MVSFVNGLLVNEMIFYNVYFLKYFYFNLMNFIMNIMDYVFNYFMCMLDQILCEYVNKIFLFVIMIWRILKVFNELKLEDIIEMF